LAQGGSRECVRRRPSCFQAFPSLDQMFDALDHGESIYNIIPAKEVQPEKMPMYRSKFMAKVPPTASTLCTKGTTHPVSTNLSGASTSHLVPPKEARTMGKPPGASKSHPEEFTKKGSRHGRVQPLNEVKRENPDALIPSVLKTQLKPAVPRADEKPVMNQVTSKNFVVSNAVETILAAPKKGPQKTKDYLAKEDYGKVPRYLQHIKKDIEDEYEYIRKMQQQEEVGRSSVRELDEDERLQLIDGLKTRWEKINTDYQAGTHLTKLDTIGKIKRKEKHEAELTQIEKDIERLNRKTIIIDERC